jgi:hypothetical protein
LEIDYEIYEEIPKEKYKQKSIYLLHYPNSEKVKYSIGMINYIEEDNINYLCYSQDGSSGGPLLNLSNYKVIGIHKRGKENKNMNVGTFLKAPIDEFNKKEKKIGNDQEENKNNIFEDKDYNLGEMTIIYQNRKLEKIDEKLVKFIKEKGGEEASINKIFGEKFVKNNRNKCKIIINGKEKDIFSFFDIEKMKENEMIEIKLKVKKKIEDMSYMFCGCLSLVNIKDIKNIEINNQM